MGIVFEPDGPAPALRGWRRLAGTSGSHPSLAVPQGNAAYRVRVWTVDHGKQPVSLIADAVAPTESGEAAFAAGDGIALTALKLGDESLGIGRIKLDRAVPIAHPRHYSVKTTPA